MGIKSGNRVHDTETWVQKTQKDGTFSQRTAPKSKNQYEKNYTTIKQYYLQKSVRLKHLNEFVDFGLADAVFLREIVTDIDILVPLCHQSRVILIHREELRILWLYAVLLHDVAHRQHRFQKLILCHQLINYLDSG